MRVASVAALAYPATRSGYGFKPEVITIMRALTIGKIAHAAGVHLETIRYYERIRLMPRPGRTKGGHRAYGAEHIRRLAFIRRARELGFGIEDIRTLLALADPEQGSCAKVLEVASLHLASVRLKLADLARLEQVLADTVARCSGSSSPVCPVLDILAPNDRPSLRGWAASRQG
jgi:MerR family transcriptional regulator, mercuric resistance operon regulatory protein